MPTLLPLWRATRTTGKQCGLTATGDYQPSLRSPWLAASEGDLVIIHGGDATQIPSSDAGVEVNEEPGGWGGIMLH
ncbi:MAG: hypothetical protein ROD09_00310 [Candidatus Sedimenticola sp. (ex Thyasira tokunagai)]